MANLPNFDEKDIVKYLKKCVSNFGITITKQREIQLKIIEYF